MGPSRAEGLPELSWVVNLLVHILRLQCQRSWRFPALILLRQQQGVNEHWRAAGVCQLPALSTESSVLT